MQVYNKNIHDPLGKEVYGNLMKEEYVAFDHTHDLPFFCEMVGITHPDPDYFVKRKHCDRIVLEYVVSGKGHLEYNGEDFELNAGDVYLLLPGSSHKYSAAQRQPFEKIWINFVSEMFVDIIHKLQLDIVPVFRSCERLKPLFNKLLQTAQENEIHDVLHARISVIVYSILVEMATTKDLSPSASDIARYTYGRLTNRIYSNPKIKDIADMLFVSETHLINEFKKAYGVTPHQFLINKRLEIAKSLLKNTDTSVSDISKKLSFENVHYFSTFFKSKTGLTPTQFRNK